MTRKYTTLPYKEYPVATGNFDKTRAKIDTIILHHTVSTYQSAISWFGNSKAGTSAHYIVSNNGEIAAMLEEYWTAFHCGNYATNQRSIGIETEWYEGMTRSEKLYETTINLTADICKYYAITPSTQTIRPHSSVVATKCPGTLDINKIIEGVKKKLNSSPCEANLQACLTAHKQAMDKVSKQEEMIKNLQGELSSCNALRNQGLSAQDILQTDIKRLESELAIKVNQVSLMEGDIKALEAEVIALKAEADKEESKPVPYKKLYQEAQTELLRIETLITTDYTKLGKSKVVRAMQRALIDIESYIINHGK